MRSPRRHPTNRRRWCERERRRPATRPGIWCRVGRQPACRRRSRARPRRARGRHWHRRSRHPARARRPRAIGRLPFQPDLLALDQRRVGGRRFRGEAGVTSWRLQPQILHRLLLAATSTVRREPSRTATTVASSNSGAAAGTASPSDSEGRDRSRSVPRGVSDRRRLRAAAGRAAAPRRIRPVRRRRRHHCSMPDRTRPAWR